MSEVVMVIAQNIFRDEEYAVPKRVLEERGADVVTASMAKGTCLGKLGMLAEASTSVADALDRSWDAVIFVGGAGAQIFFDDKDAQQLAKDSAAQGRILGAICIAPSTLAHAGLLAGVNATAFPSQKDDLIKHGARWSDQPVVVDGHIITANGPEAAEAFGQAIADKLGL